MDVSIIIYFLTGILFAVISVPLILNKVKINNWYGIRLPATMTDENIWYKTNNKFGKVLFVFGILLSVICAVFYFTNIISNLFEFIFVTLFTLIGVIIIAIRAAIYADKLNRRQE